MITPEVACLGIEQADLLLLGAAGARLVGHIVLQEAVDDQVAIIAIMAEGIHILLVAVSRRISVRSDALARRVGIFQLGCGVAEAEAILLVGRQVELGATLFAGTLRHAGGGIATTDVIALVGADIGAGELRTEQALNDRTGQIETSLLRVAADIVHGAGVLGRDAAGPFVTAATGDDIDHPAHGFRAIERGHRPADHLDPLDHRDRRQADLLAAIGTVGVDHAAGGNRPAIDQIQRIGVIHAANADVLHIAAAGDEHTGDVTHGIGHIGVGLLLQLLAGNDRDAGRRIGDVLLVACGGHHGNGLQLDHSVACRILGYRIDRQPQRSGRHRQSQLLALEHSHALHSPMTEFSRQSPSHSLRCAPAREDGRARFATNANNSYLRVKRIYKLYSLQLNAHTQAGLTILSPDMSLLQVDLTLRDGKPKTKTVAIRPGLVQSGKGPKDNL